MQMPMVALLTKVETGRCVGIEIANKTKSITLSSPSTYCDSGFVYCPPPPTISPGTVDHCIFVKTPSTACGSVGVLTHFSGTHTVTILFSNPFDYNIHNILFGALITEKTRKADHALYNEICNTEKQGLYHKLVEVTRDGESLEVHCDHVKVLATMSNDKKAILRVEILETGM
ncbi:DELTA-thalatoxin-Avl1b-like [Xenopus laevis]|uniref:DELTA-thalatoxin-Avl1b-like n=1 Tax=Xenopus laevis TaxID=8355 RepID=A0A8J1LZ25_XENLA|nr:DELTA-thalatoxin-Avl1b-like [Xenopus laevis]